MYSFLTAIVFIALACIAATGIYHLIKLIKSIRKGGRNV
jgi:hypothetical protein